MDSEKKEIDGRYQSLLEEFELYKARMDTFRHQCEETIPRLELEISHMHAERENQLKQIQLLQAELLVQTNSASTHDLCPSIEADKLRAAISQKCNITLLNIMMSHDNLSYLPLNFCRTSNIGSRGASFGEGWCA